MKYLIITVISDKYKNTAIGFRRIDNLPLEADTYFENRASAVDYAQNNHTAFNGQRIFFKNEAGDYEERQVYDGTLLRPLSTGNGCTIVDRLSSYLPFRASINSTVLLDRGSKIYLGLGNYRIKYQGNQFELHGGGLGTAAFDKATGILTVNIPLESGKDYLLRSTFHTGATYKCFDKNGNQIKISNSSGYPDFKYIYVTDQYKYVIFQTRLGDKETTYGGGKLDIYECIERYDIEKFSYDYSIYRYAGKGQWLYSGRVNNDNKVFAKQSNALVYKDMKGDFTVEYPSKPFTGVDIRSIVKIRKCSFGATDNPNVKDDGFVQIPEELPMPIGVFIYKKRPINNYSKVDGVENKFRVAVTKYHFYKNINEMFSGSYKDFIEKLLKRARLCSRNGRYGGYYYCKFYLSFYYLRTSRYGIDHYYPVGNKMHFVAYKSKDGFVVKYAPDKH